MNAVGGPLPLHPGRGQGLFQGLRTLCRVSVSAQCLHDHQVMACEHLCVSAAVCVYTRAFEVAPGHGSLELDADGEQRGPGARRERKNGSQLRGKEALGSALSGAPESPA